MQAIALVIAFGLIANLVVALHGNWRGGHFVRKTQEPKSGHCCRPPLSTGPFGIFGPYPGLGSQWLCDRCGVLWTMEEIRYSPTSSSYTWTNTVGRQDCRDRSFAFD